MKRVLAGVVAAVGISMVGSIAPASVVFSADEVGLDVSWPNCGVKLPKTDFRIVGVNGGIPFTKNKCLAGQAAGIEWPDLSLYVNTAWHGLSDKVDARSPKRCAVHDKQCFAYNYGYNSGLQAFDSARAAGVVSLTWWLDVEQLNDWTKDLHQNRASLQGTYDALRQRGIPMIGVYSTPYQWVKITGGWRPGWYTWVATGLSDLKQAKRFCVGNQFAGGRTLLVQYIPPRPYLDHNVAC